VTYHPTAILTPSGSDDHATIQTALDAKQWVGLHGVFRVKQPLNVVAPARLIGIGERHSIHYIGETTSNSVINVDNSNGEVGGLHNLLTYSYGKARGLRMYRCCSPEVLTNVWVRDTHELAVDLVDCWAGRLSGLRISGNAGPALRLERFNCGLIDGLDIAACTLGTSWPDDLPESRRAIVVIGDGSVQSFRNVMIQSSECAGYPSIYSRAQGMDIDQLYMEGVVCGESVVVLDGSSKNGWAAVNTTIRNTLLSMGAIPHDGNAEGKAKYFVKATGYAKNTLVDGITSLYGSLTKAVVWRASTSSAKVQNVLAQDLSGKARSITGVTTV
jgi:hypothetical protein